MAEFPVQVTFTLKDQLSYALYEVKNAISGFTNGMSGAEKSTNSFQKAMEVAAGVMIRDFARSAFTAVTGALNQANENFKKYEMTLTRIVGATNATGDAADALSVDLARVSSEQTDLGYSSRESASALEALVKAGMSGSDAAEALRASLSLARLENIDTATAANYLVQTLTQFHLKATDSADALNLISKAADAGIGTASDYAAGLSNAGASAANMGLSLKETLAALVILDKTFGSATESGTFLNMLFKDLVLKSDKLGISLYNTDGSMKNLSEIIGMLREKVAGFGDNQQAVNEYLSVFDVRAQRAVVGLLNYDGSLDDVIGSMDEARNVQDKLNMVMDTTGGKLVELTARQENATYKLGEMTAGMQLAWKEFAVGLGPIGAVADAMGPAMLQGAMNGLIVMLPTIIKSLNTLGLSTQTLALSAGAAFGAFTLGLTILNALPPEIRGVAGAITAVIAGLVAATVAAAVFWGTISVGTAVPVILAAVGAAVAGITVALQDAGVEADSYSVSIGHAASASEAFANTIQTKTAKQINDLETALQQQIETLQTSYDDQVEIVEQSYNDQIAATRNFYDDLIAEVNDGLRDIQNARSNDLDDLELTYLLQKQLIKDAYASGSIDKETFEAKLNDIERTYRDQRADMSDTYRIQELTYEKAHRGEVEKLEQEKNTTIENLESEHAAKLEGMEQEKNTTINSLTAAAVAEKEAIISTANQRIIQNAIDSNNQMTALGRQMNSAYVAGTQAHQQAVQRAATIMALPNVTPSQQIQNIPIAVSPELGTNVYTGTLAQYNALPYDVKKYYAAPAYQEGGIAWTKQLALVGEKEPELIIPVSKVETLSGASRNRRGVNIVVYPFIHIGRVSSKVDVKALEALVVRKTRDALIEAQEAY